MDLHKDEHQQVEEGGIIEPQPGEMWTAHGRWTEGSVYVLLKLEKSDGGYDMWTFKAYDIVHKNMTSVYFNIGNYHLWERLA